MKVNRKLNKLIRKHKSKCENSKIHCVRSLYDIYSTTFTFEPINTKRWRKSDGAIYSCIITKTKYGSCIIIYYDGLDKYKMELYPGEIKGISYKT